MTTRKTTASKATDKSNTESKSKGAKSAAGKGAKKTSKTTSNLRLFEKRRHPRFLLSREQFREVKSGQTFSVYDLSLNGLSIKVDKPFWQVGTLIQGILNLHPDSVELTPRLIGYYGDRAALKLESMSTYSRTVISKALSPRRLGESLKLVREKLPLADYWYHGLCNTDLLLRLGQNGSIAKVEIFFSNFYWSWTDHAGSFSTGLCQSIGKDKREDQLLAEEPVKLESIDLEIDAQPDGEKTRWAKGIIEAAPLDPRLHETLLKKFENSLQK